MNRVAVFLPERSPDRPLGQIVFTRMGQKMKSYKRVIGIDISTERLDIADSNSKIVHEVDYMVDAIKSKILKLIKKPSETLVVCEATGGLEYTLVDVLHDAKIDVIRSVPGVGPVMTATLVAELPELGTISRTKIAKLVGVAPMIKQSGKSEERRRARGGRGGVRRVLYMATLAATQKNDVIKKRYIKLLASGKPKKLALVACMRTLLTILNDMVRHETKWGEKKKSVAGSVVSNRPAPAHVLDKS